MFGRLFGKNGDKATQWDSEFEQKDNHLNLFLQAQEILITMGQGEPKFNDKREKLRYLHFMFGAIDQLSRTIKDDKRAELWWTITSTARASLILGVNDAFSEKKRNGHTDDAEASLQRGVDDAFSEWERYGNTDDTELMDAGKRGYFAMQTYILNAIGKCTPEEFRQSCTELFSVVYAKT